MFGSGHPVFHFRSEQKAVGVGIAGGAASNLRNACTKSPLFQFHIFPMH